MATTNNTNKNEKRVVQIFTIRLGKAIKGQQTHVKGQQQQPVVFRGDTSNSQKTRSEPSLQEEIINSEHIDLKGRRITSWHGG